MRINVHFMNETLPMHEIYTLLYVTYAKNIFSSKAMTKK